MICEAENNGEISIDTRDRLLGIIEEDVKESDNEITDIKLMIYESELSGEITAEERDMLIKNINEKSSNDLKMLNDTWKRARDLVKIEDNNELQNKLIEHTKKSKFSDSQCNVWSQTYDVKNQEKIFLKLKKMDLGYCYGDDGSNYIVYSFKTKKFYFFDHENDGEENLSHVWDINRIKKHLSYFN